MFLRERFVTITEKCCLSCFWRKKELYISICSISCISDICTLVSKPLFVLSTVFFVSSSSQCFCVLILKIALRCKCSVFSVAEFLQSIKCLMSCKKCKIADSDHSYLFIFQLSMSGDILVNAKLCAGTNLFQTGLEVKTMPRSSISCDSKRRFLELSQS